jgi:hypothetical protein
MQNTTERIKRCIVPGREDCVITVPAVGRLMGDIVDLHSNGVFSSIIIQGKKIETEGRFSLFPLQPGTYTVLFHPSNYAPFEETVTISTNTVNLGTKAVTNTGVTITGKVADTNGKSLRHAALFIQDYTIGENFYRVNTGHTRANLDGTFTIKGLPENSRVTLVIQYKTDSSKKTAFRQVKTAKKAMVDIGTLPVDLTRDTH